jgi:hypothetical protein
MVPIDQYNGRVCIYQWYPNRPNLLGVIRIALKREATVEWTSGQSRAIAPMRAKVVDRVALVFDEI